MPTTNKVQIQSNSIRDDFLKSIMDRTINEILASVSSLLGPGATDAYLIGENGAYYTRDGKEVCESLIFDNEIARWTHHILHQAVYNQGRNAGDGSTTLAVLYCYLYKLLRNQPQVGGNYEEIRFNNINEVRSIWKRMTEQVIDKLKERSVPLTEDLLLSMLYTCTQDAELAAKIYDQLKDPIMAGAYIVPRKSNINTDFHVTIHNRPTYKVTTHFTMKPIQPESEYNVVYFCNGTIDIAHSELLAAMNMAVVRDPYKPGDPNAFIFPNIILLGTGVSEATRNSIREYSNFMRNVTVNPDETCNVTIMTLDEYRAMSNDELEDLATVLTNYPGLGGLVQPLTFETYLYRTFLTPDAQKVLHIEPIQELETFDADPSLVTHMQLMFNHPYRVMYDEKDGIALDKELQSYAKERYEQLRKDIEEEKSPVRKVELNKRLRRSFGMFIDLEVGSVLLKDSQRKFELILDAIISTAEAARDGVLIGNSMIHTADIVYRLAATDGAAILLMDALDETVNVLVHNAYPETIWDTMTLEECIHDEEHRVVDFNLKGSDEVWPKADDEKTVHMIDTTITTDDGESKDYHINPVVVESYNAIKAIIENSVLPIELARTKQMTLSGRQGLMGNYID